jgi:hypothetical protein
MRKKRKIELKSRSPVIHRDYTKHTRCAYDGCVRYVRKNSKYCYICGGIAADGFPTPEEIDEMEKEMGRIAVNNLGFLHSLMTEAPFGLTPLDYRATRAQDIGITPEEKEE